eukprot:s230_g10.t1
MAMQIMMNPLPGFSNFGTVTYPSRSRREGFAGRSVASIGSVSCRASLTIDQMRKEIRRSNGWSLWVQGAVKGAVKGSQI